MLPSWPELRAWSYETITGCAIELIVVGQPSTFFFSYRNLRTKKSPWTGASLRAPRRRRSEFQAPPSTIYWGLRNGLGYFKKGALSYMTLQLSRRPANNHCCPFSGPVLLSLSAGFSHKTYFWRGNAHERALCCMPLLRVPRVPQNIYTNLSQSLTALPCQSFHPKSASTVRAAASLFLKIYVLNTQYSQLGSPSLIS